MFAEGVSVLSQGILAVVATGGFALITLVINRRAEARTAERDALAKKVAEDAAIAKEERDYAREDKVAAQAAEAARLLVEANNKVARAAAQTAIEQASIRHEVAEVKDLGVVTHALVNSDKTAGMKRERVGLIAQRAALIGQLRMAEFFTTSDQPLPAEVRDSLNVIREQVKVLDVEITTLEAEIAARLAEQHRAEAAVQVAKDMKIVPQEPAINIESATIDAGTVTVQPKTGFPPPTP